MYTAPVKNSVGVYPPPPVSTPLAKHLPNKFYFTCPNNIADNKFYAKLEENWSIIANANTRTRGYR